MLDRVIDRLRKRALSVLIQDPDPHPARPPRLSRPIQRRRVQDETGMNDVADQPWKSSDCDWR
jgi:hypothetical protein